MRKGFLTATMAVFLIVLPSSAQYGGRRDDDGGRREDVRRRIESYRIWRMTEVLDLDPETAAEFFPLDSRLSDLNEEHEAAMREKSDDLEDLIESDADPNDLNRLMDDMTRMEEDHLEAVLDIREDMRRVLSPRQMAEYLVFERNFRRELRELISSNRNRRRGGDDRRQGPGGQGPGGQGGEDRGGPPPPPPGGGYDPGY